MNKKPGWLSSVLRLKCAKCRKGAMFIPIQKLSDWFKMRENCPVCESRLYMEPGFYWGAMYVSYAISSALVFILFFLAYLGFGWSLTNSFIFLTVIVMLISPYIFRLSRSFWFAAFNKYDSTIPEK